VTLSTITLPTDSLGAVDGLVGGAEITWEYRDTRTVTLNLGTGASTVNVLGAGAPTVTNIFNSANATINVGSTGGAGSVAGIQGALNLENEPAFDTVTINSQNDSATQTVTLSTIARSGDSSLGSIDGLVGGAPIT
jgi:hypothetical protein